MAFCSFGDYSFAPRHFPKVRGVARATAVAEVYKAFLAFLGIGNPDCSGFKNQSRFSK
jgi:hypothetical protein